MKSFPVGLSDEQRAAFQAAADKLGVSLAQWLRDAGDLRLAGLTDARLTELAAEAERGYDVEKLLRGSGKRTYAPDPKVKKPKK